MRARIWGILILGLALAGGLWWGLSRWQSERERKPVARPPVAQVAPPAAQVPQARYPLPEGLSLPEGELTEASLRNAIYQLGDRRSIDSMLHMEDFVRRAVATTDNLPADNLPMQIRAFKDVPGAFGVTARDGVLVLDARNYSRYQPMVRLLESLDTRQTTLLFVRFYPLFQRQYRELGYPDQHFNDRLVAAIDDLLAAPELRGPVRLEQPRVLYRFADPELESLSAGRKLMIRMGPDNAARVKARLKAIRQALTEPATAAPSTAQR